MKPIVKSIPVALVPAPGVHAPSIPAPRVHSPSIPAIPAPSVHSPIIEAPTERNIPASIPAPVVPSEVNTWSPRIHKWIVTPYTPSIKSVPSPPWVIPERIVLITKPSIIVAIVIINYNISISI